MFNVPKYFKLRCIALLFIGGSFCGYSQKCESDLKVEKDRSYRSLDINDGVVFNLSLTNTSISNDTYTIVTEDLKIDCANKHYPSKGSNTPVFIEVLSKDGRPLSGNKISIRSGESIQFKVKISTAKNTVSDRWSCIDVKAISDNCKTETSNTILKVYVPNLDSGE
ncbi:hypothetical protein [Winogradskyella sp.]|uniref:hypothetical protein n=1 Tax=Winogradskyella sp. TaxID=1883156 RepID=UPI003BA93EE6